MKYEYGKCSIKMAFGGRGEGGGLVCQPQTGYASGFHVFVLVFPCLYCFTGWNACEYLRVERNLVVQFVYACLR